MGRSEELSNATSPTWAKEFLVDYRFEERQIIRVEVFDGKMLLGWVEPPLGSIVSAPGKEYRYPPYSGRIDKFPRPSNSNRLAK